MNLRALLIFLVVLLSVGAVCASAAEDREPIRSAIEARVSEDSVWDRVEVEGLRVETDLHIPEGADVEVLDELSARPLGRRSFAMVAHSGTATQAFEASAVVRAYGTVYYLAAPLARGELVTPAGLIAREMDITRIPKDAITDPMELDGLAASRPVSVNLVLRTSYFKRLPAARKGERVLLVADTVGVRVATPGVLAEDGYIGRFVRVTNMVSGKEVSGWFTSPGRVDVRF